jgi:hypothetical protein
METMSRPFFALALIFGLGRPAQAPLDAAKGVPLASRIPCDGYTAPEDAVPAQVTFSSGAWAREFVLSRFQEESCAIDLKIKCLHKERAGWRPVWQAASARPSAAALLPLDSCYAWGSSRPAKYVLSGWYKEGAQDSKLAWRQAAVKEASAGSRVYEFSDPRGGTARLEFRPW